MAKAKPKPIRENGTYSVEADALFEKIKTSTRALHTVEKLAGFLPSVARWAGDVETVLKPDPESIADAVAELESRGLVETWADAPGGPRVILSNLTAERLGIELDGTGRSWRPLRARRRASRMKHREKVRQDLESGVLVEQAADPAAQTYVESHDLDGPRPRVLLGLRIPWSGPDVMARQRTPDGQWTACPGCFDAAPQVGRTCLVCDDLKPGEKPLAVKRGGRPKGKPGASAVA